MNKVSIKDIAELTGVSIATVSRVINNNGRFSEETRRKVMKAIEDTGYNMNYSAKSLRMNRSNIIGILIPDITNAFFAILVNRIESLLFEKGYVTIISSTNRDINKEISYLKMMSGQNIDGLIAVSGAQGFSFEDEFRNIPYITIDRRPKNNGSSILITSDHINGGYEVAREFHKHGVIHPVVVINNTNSPATQDRITGFKNYYEENGLLFSEDDHVLFYDKNSLDFMEGLSHRINDRSIDAIFASNDMIAIELIKKLKLYDIQIPEDVRIVGFDDIPISKLVTPALTTVRQDIDSLAEVAVEKLLQLVEDKKNGKATHIKIPVTLISRESC